MGTGGSDGTQEEGIEGRRKEGVKEERHAVES